MNLIIDDYISGDASLCREKSQYTAMLYSILSGSVKVKLELETYENKNYEVFRSYYEPAFLRGFFDEAGDKAAFNRELLDFTNQKLKEVIKLCGKKRGKMNPPDVKVEKLSPESCADLASCEEIYDLSGDIKNADAAADFAKHINGWGKPEKAYRNPVAKWMMNIKPDIALLLKRRGIKRGEYRLHFLNLEYLTGPEGYPVYVSVYNKEHTAMTECYRVTLSKRVICDYVIEFLCRELFVQGDQEKAVLCDPGITSVSSFVSDKNPAAEGISLSKLCLYFKRMNAGEKVKEPKLLLGETIGLSI